MKQWLVFAVLVLLGWLIKRLVTSTYLRLRDRIDRAVPDHLPMGAGDWLRTQMPEGVRLVVGSHSTPHADAFHPSSNVIVLSRDVYTKRDASFWAVAAHELGHAIVDRGSWLIASVTTIARVTVATCTALGSFTIFANVLYARPEISAFAFHLLEASLLAYVVVLVDEGAASVVAFRILHRDPRVDRRDLIGASTALLAAFMTYVGGFTGQVVLVLEREFIVAMIAQHRHFVPAEPMGAARMTVVVVLSTALVVWSVVQLRHALWPKRFTTTTEIATGCLWSIGHHLGRGALGAALVWLVWDQPFGSLMPALCVMGLVASRGVLAVLAGIAEFVIRLIAAIPATILLGLGWIVFRIYAWALLDWELAPPEARPSPPPPPPDSERTRAALDALELENANHRSVLRTLTGALDPVLHLAFVVGVLIQIVRHL